MRKKITNLHLLITRCVLTVLVLGVSATFATGQEVSPSQARLNRERGLQILSIVKNIIKEQYYDPKFRGLDLDKHFKATQVRIKELDTAPQIFTAIAQAVIDFNDSHTRYLPPPRINRVEYGFSMQMVDDVCRVVDVKHGSAAEAKGLKVGDAISDISGYRPRRDSLWALTYLLYTIEPRPELALNVTGIDGVSRQVVVPLLLVTPDERKRRSNRRKDLEKQHPELKAKLYKCQEINSDLIACKLYTFEVDPSVIDKMMKEVGERKQMILDLRGNGGGRVETESKLTGYFFDHDVKIGSEIGRRQNVERIAKSRKEKAFKGKLVVLVDSFSASASEVFARVIQIEKRGEVVGDTSAGAVMTSLRFSLDFNEARAFGGMSVTISDLLMTDGKRLEGTGVVPDFKNVPNGQSLAERSDPTLAFAASLCGARLSKEEAGKFYFIADVPEVDSETDKEDK